MKSCELESVTPAKAEKWLNTCNTNNRKMRPGIAEKYAADMRAGRWTQCFDPIRFCEDGSLADGQHRLWAIVESGTTQHMMIVHGLTREDMLNIDTGATRSLVDNAHISGVDPTLSAVLVSTALAFTFGDRSGYKRRFSYSGRMEIVNACREHAEWAVKHGPKAKNIRNAVVLGAIARAHRAGVDLERLERYCRVLENPAISVGPAESSATLMHSWLKEHRNWSHIDDMWTYAFRATQNSIDAFLKKTPRTQVRRISEETFPLPAAKRAAKQKAPATRKGDSKNSAAL